MNECSVAQLGQLLLLASSNLPIGSYTYSQGVEAAIESQLIRDETSALSFMQDYLHLAVIEYELPMLGLIMQALAQNQKDIAEVIAADYHAGLESQEFVLESEQLAQAMVSWLNEVHQLGIARAISDQGFLPLFAHIAQHWQLPITHTMTTYGFAQLENMVLAAVKTVPLGQMAGQRILWSLQRELSEHAKQIHHRVTQAFSTLTKPPIFHQDKGMYQNPHAEQLCHHLYEQLMVSNNLPNLAMLSSKHEVQYSRLFRS